jgi:prepilin signal peptidase PulO-like enzyme (type II secretory pathway)
LGVFFTFLPLLLVVSYIDFKTFRIPDSLNFAILILGLGFVFHMHLVGTGVWQSALISASAIFVLGMLFALLTNGAIGGGDIKLVTALSFPVGALGYDHIALAWFVIGCCSLIHALGVIGLRKSLKTMVPFGPCLALGYLAAMV